MTGVKKIHEPVRPEWMTETQKAEQLNLTVSMLQKDRRKPEPAVPFRKIGKLVRYHVDA